MANQEQIPLGRGGWFGFEWDGADVYVRFDERNGRLGIAELYFPPTYLGHINGEVLRSVPWSSIEDIANGPLAERIKASIAEDPEASHVLLDARATVGPASVARLPSSSPLAGSLLLLATPGQRQRQYDDEFYKRVAHLWTATTLHPSRARAIAEANDVPVTTVNRWVKEARRRGHLGSASRRAERTPR